MTETVVEISRNKRESQRKLALDKGLKDATRDYLKRRWATNTAKNAARTFDLSVDQGRSAANGTPSLTTIEQIFKSGGLLMAIQILEDVTGERLADIIREIRGLHDENVRAVGAFVRDPWPDAGAGGAGGAAGGSGLRGQPLARRRRRG